MNARKILENARTIAVIGMSRNPGKAAHYVPEYLKGQGYRIIPINPNAEEILGEKSYPRISEIPDAFDTVLVFRPSDEVPGIVDEILGLDTAPDNLWLQLGITDSQAEKRARQAGLTVVSDRCMMVEHRRL